MRMSLDTTITYEFDKKRLIELCDKKITEKEKLPEMNLDHFQQSRKIAKLLIIDGYDKQDFFSMFTLKEIQGFIEDLIAWPDYSCDEEDIIENPISQIIAFDQMINRSRYVKSAKRRVFI